MKIIVTGGCGFIGSHTVEHFHQNTDWEIIVIDKLNYASKGYERLRNTATLDSGRVKVFCVDLAIPITEGLRYEMGEDIDIILHMAAETHVDNSISDPIPFVKNNVNSTLHLLEYARTLPKLKKFFYFSTDEVFGAAPDGVAYREWDRHSPTNPYSASKSAAENICLAYQNTYDIPVIICNTMNVIGERQYPEKFVPNTIRKIRNNEMVQIHANPDKTKPGSRFYIHARNVAAAVLFLLELGKIGDKYNIVGEKEIDNLEMAQLIANVMNKELKYEMIDFHSVRKGHDPRYALDGEKMKKMGWEIPIPFYESLRKTVLWSLDNPEWLEY